MVSMADVVPEEVPWLWKHRLPRGEITIIDGDPGLGKSLLTAELASHISTGTAWPDGSPCQCGVVLMLSAEDDPRRTIRPRLEVAGAALGMVYAFQDQIGLEDLVRVRALADRYDAVLVIIDPLMAYLSTGANSWKDQDMRHQLQPVQQMARDLDLSVIIVRHLNKSGGKAIYRGQGSIGTIAAVRMGWLLERDPDNPDVRVLACNKSNLGPEPPSLTYRIDQVPLRGFNDPVGKVTWTGVSDHTADTLLGNGKGKEVSAVAFLTEFLAGAPVESRLIFEAAEVRGISRNAVWTAKKSMGIKASKEGYGTGAPWKWGLDAPSILRDTLGPDL